jgi:hypothetical protein
MNLQVESIKNTVGYTVRDTGRDTVMLAVRYTIRNTVWYTVRDTGIDTVMLAVRYTIRKTVYNEIPK